MEFNEFREKVKIKFSLERRLQAFNSQYGGLSQAIQNKVEKLDKFSKNDKLYYEKMEKVIKYIRSRLIP